MLVGMEIEEEVDQGPFEPCPPTGVEEEPGTTELGASSEVDQAKTFAELDVIERLEGKLSRGAMDPNLRVVCGVPTQGHAGVREIRDHGHDRVPLDLGLGAEPVELGDPIPDRAHLCLPGLGLGDLFLPHERPDFLGGAVALGLELLGLGQGGSTAFIEGQDLGHPGLIPGMTRGEAFADPVGLLTEQLDVEHGCGA